MQKGIKNALIAGGSFAMGYSTNSPYNEDTLHQYYGDETKAFFHENLKWSSNLVRAQVQGVNYEDFYAYTTLNVRTANLIDPTTGKNLGSDWQRIIIENPSVDFLPRGAKVIYNGNVWLVTNPMNIQSVTGTSVVRRCNATWHYLDYYGNVKSEPFCYGQGDINLATGNSVKDNMILMDSYQHCVMQYNPDTAVIAHNMRMILGNQAYSVRGVQDFVQEFSLDEESTHIQFFDLEAAEPLVIDDMENKVAGGKTFRWEIRLSASSDMQVGTSQKMTVASYRSPDWKVEEWAYLQDNAGKYMTVQKSGVAELLLVKSEVRYVWTCSDETVATVDETGTVTAIKSGTAVITCALAENPSIWQEFTIEVSGAQTGASIVWKEIAPDELAQYESATISAVVFENGEETEKGVAFALSGPEEGAYYSAETNGNSVTVTCWLPSPTPLVITATADGAENRATIRLKGW